MKFATCRIGGNAKSEIVLVDTDRDRAWPVSELVPGFDGNMTALIRDYANLAGQLTPSGEGVALGDVALCAPIPRPGRNIFCVGKNYFEHAKEFAQSGYDSSAKGAADAVPTAPIVFTKATTTVIAPGDLIPRHAGVTEQIDYEAELAVIIGTGGRGISRADAYKHVWGYTIANDVTARDLQAKHKQWFIGKSLDGFCPMGPWIVTSDEVDPENLSLRCWVNGELRQDANTKDLIFDIPTIVETLSAGMTLEPGDIISTGTPVGVGIGFKPPRFLDTGDTVRIEIDGIGELENTVG
ncbi:MAG: fumarylacetoacetate hydrolase family protein [Rhodospirillales bacterium]|nr:fumarylacetoacetate hydrolase family protein [Rhodospirillales bacterium]